MSARISKMTLCLWYDHNAEDAAKFYAQTFPGSSVSAVRRAPGDYPTARRVMRWWSSSPCSACPASAQRRRRSSIPKPFSFQVETDSQEETDRYWNAIVGNGGQENQCGWCKDKWGLSWQITPKALTEAMAKGGEAAKRSFAAMMTMKKIDIAGSRQRHTPMRNITGGFDDGGWVFKLRDEAAGDLPAFRGGSTLVARSPHHDIFAPIGPMWKAKVRRWVRRSPARTSTC